jgi:uncharacterized protein YcbX
MMGEATEATARGAVQTLYRYPIKSMLGELLRSVAVTERGFAGDRVAALADGEHIASAKYPAKWSLLLHARATAIDGAIRVTLPDGTSTSSADPDFEELLSAYVGRPVRFLTRRPADPVIERLPGYEIGADDAIEGTIAAAAPEGFFDFAPLHLVSTATLAALGDADARRFRPNVVVAVPGEGFVENGWVGRRVRIGSEVVLEVIIATPRCVVPSLAHDDLPFRTDAVRAAAKHNRLDIGLRAPQPCAGVYARVVQSGTMQIGDEVVVT